MEEHDATFYPSVPDVLKAYGETLGISSEDTSNCVRDFSLLESALNRPQAAAYYEQADLTKQAASLLWGLVRNHPFVDGNKRTAFVVMMGFLRANGWTINATTDDKFTFMVDVAEHLTTQDAAEWIRERAKPFEG